MTKRTRPNLQALTAGQDIPDAEPTLGPGKLTPEAARGFLFLGHAVLTAVNTETGGRMTFKVQAPRQQREGKPECHWLSVKTGDGFEFLGSIFGRNADDYRHSFKSALPANCNEEKATLWFVRKLMADQLPATLELWHEGFCGRCGRGLTVPESIASGIGPDCARKITREAA